MEIFDLTDKIAVVTGGSQGIGFAIAKGLAKSGATIFIANRNSLKGKGAAETLQVEGLKASAISTDVRDESSVRNLIAKVIQECGKIDIFVNCAAVALRKPTLDMSKDDWHYIMDTNLWGLFLCCQLVGREMIKRKYGKIINFSSDIAYRAMEDRAVYATSKAGVTHLTKCLALEWAKYNVYVNGIAPGATLTDMNKDYYEKNPDRLRIAIDFSPLGRVGDTSDYVGAAIFLASDASNYMIGQTLLIEGGTTIW